MKIVWTLFGISCVALGIGYFLPQTMIVEKVALFIVEILFLISSFSVAYHHDKRKSNTNEGQTRRLEK